MTNQPKPPMYTPGPWEQGVDFYSRRIYVNGGQIHIANIASSVPDAEREANARLIAAAPDLLGALVLAQATLNDILSNVLPYGQRDAIEADIYKINSVISKATNNQSS